MDGEGAEWTEEDGVLRFRVRHGAALWETACRAGKDELLIYGSYPFRPRDGQSARAECERINRRLARGAMFLTEDGAIVYRCRAEMDDVYGARERLRAALDYSAKAMLQFWGQMSRL